MSGTEDERMPRMRALRWHGQRDLRVENVPVPQLGPTDALVRVERVGLCGTDLEEYCTGPHDIPVDRPHPISGAIAPMIPGHELVGTVVRCDTRPELVGRTVIPDVVQGCGTCWWCRRHDEGLCPDLVVLGQTANGGLAEFVRCRAETLVEVPGGLSIDVAAFAEPTAVAVRAVAKAGNLRGCTVAIVGAGVVGNLIAQVARAHGARVVAIDTGAWRLELAEAAGVAIAAVETSVERVSELTGRRMADVVFECAGREASFELAMTLARRGGTIILVGIGNTTPPLPWRDIVLREQRLLGTAAHIWDVDVATAVELLASGLVDPAPLITRIVGLDDVAATLEEMTGPSKLAKVLVDPQRAPRERSPR